MANGITCVTYLQTADRLSKRAPLNSFNAAYFNVSSVIAFVTLDRSKNSIGWPRNSPIANPKPINQPGPATNFFTRCKTRSRQDGKLSLPLNSKYRHGITTMSPTGYRVAAPRPEMRPTRRSSGHGWDFRSFSDNQMTSANNRLLKMWVLIKCA